MEPEVTSQVQPETKSPLESKTLMTAVATVVTTLVGLAYPPLGDWMKAHNETVLAAISTIMVYGRQTADKPINWKDWTIGGFGIKF